MFLGTVYPALHTPILRESYTAHKLVALPHIFQFIFILDKVLVNFTMWVGIF